MWSDKEAAKMKRLAVTYDGYNIKVYKDGLLTQTGAIASLPITGILSKAR